MSSGPSRGFNRSRAGHRSSATTPRAAPFLGDARGSAGSLMSFAEPRRNDTTRWGRARSRVCRNADAASAAPTNARSASVPVPGASEHRHRRSEPPRTEAALPLLEMRPASAEGDAFELELSRAKRLRIPVTFEVESLRSPSERRRPYRTYRLCFESNGPSGTRLAARRSRYGARSRDRW